MPTISLFYGIVIRMYQGRNEHNPPHFHAYYNDYKCIVNIINCEMTEGNMPAKQLKLILAWAEINKENLMSNWKLAMNGEELFKINPL